MRVMMKLGKYKFSLSTAAYQQFQRSTAYKWVAQARMGQYDNLQFVGPGKDSVNLSGQIFPHYFGGAGQLDAMRSEASQGKPLLFVDGRGKMHGYWVIESISETGKLLLDNGVPRQQDFTMQIRYYGPTLQK